VTQNRGVGAGDDKKPDDSLTGSSGKQWSREADVESDGTEILRMLRSTPTLWLPFLVAGCVLTVVDRLRVRDRLPVEPPASESTLQIAYSVYPTGATATSRSLDALVDLPLDVFLYAVGLELLVVGVIAAAGWITMIRASSTVPSPRRFLVYAGGVSILYLLNHLGTAVDLNLSVNSLLVAIGAFGMLAFIAVRLFFLPIAVLYAEPLRTAPLVSWRRSRGHGVPIFLLIVGMGLISGWLVSVPSVGVVLSVTVVGTVHAVALANLYNE